MMNDEYMFNKHLQPFLGVPDLLNELAYGVRTGANDNVMHVAVLRYTTNPVFLQKLLCSQMPLYVENDRGSPPHFLTQSYTNDDGFKAIIMEFARLRPQDFDINYASLVTKQTLLHMVMGKWPTMAKLDTLIQLGYDLEKDS